MSLDRENRGPERVRMVGEREVDEEYHLRKREKEGWKRQGKMVGLWEGLVRDRRKGTRAKMTRPGWGDDRWVSLLQK